MSDDQPPARVLPFRHKPRRLPRPEPTPPRVGSFLDAPRVGLRIDVTVTKPTDDERD